MTVLAMLEAISAASFEVLVRKKQTSMSGERGKISDW
jgi:hypothetical protein